MSEGDRQRYRALLEKACRDEGANDLAGRERVYGRMVSLNEDLLLRRGANLGPERVAGLRAVLREVLAEDRQAFEARKAPPAAPTPLPSAADTLPRRGRGERLGAMAGGAVAGAVLMLLGSWAIAPAETSPAPPPGPALPASLQTAFDASRPKVDAAVAFLGRVRKEVQERQAADGVGLTAVAGSSFVSLKAVSPKLNAALPKALRGSRVTVRADGLGYKILVDWPLCGAVQIAKPEMVDPVRAKKVLGCSHFGVWNETGAKW